MSIDADSTADIEPTIEIENDPVCDAAVDVEAARGSGLIAEFAGRIYAFCGTACRDRFLAEPALYYVPAPERASASRPKDDIGVPPSRERRPARPVIF